MDTQEKEQLAQAQLDELKAALKKSSPVTNPGGASGTISTPYISDTITLNGSNYPNTVIGGGYTVGTGLNTNANGSPYYTTGTTTGIFAAGTNSITANPWATTTSAGRMELNGDNADLVINGVSILDILKERLNVLIPNPALEKEWDQLKELGDQYRKLEADLKEKAEMWKKLNANSATY